MRSKIFKPLTIFLVFSGLALTGCNGNTGSGVPEHAHEWGEITYTWASDYSSCTATRVCSSNESHIETETVNPTYGVVVEQKCEEAGLARLTATFTNQSFETQTHDVSIEPKGHNYQFDSFVWSDFVAQAKYVCTHDASHVEYHDATMSYETTTVATCENTGIRIHTATYDGHTETKTEVLSAIGHNWSDVIYTWASDYSSCTAKRICLNDESHIETETVDSHYRTIIEQKCEETGLARLTATFSNDAFETQTHDVSIEPKGHNYQFDSFVWDGFTAKAKCICSYDDTHITYFDAEVKEEITVAPTCGSPGLKIYTATYGTHTDTKTEVLSPSAHVWGESQYEMVDENKMRAYHVCVNDSTHIEEEIVSGVYSVVTPAEPDKNGVGQYSYSFNNAAFATQTINKLIPATGTLSSLEFTLSEDGTYYIVSASNTSISGIVAIPQTYNDKPVLNIKNSGFKECLNITSVIIPDGVISIGEFAFSGLTKDLTIRIPETIEYIGVSAFKSGLENGTPFRTYNYDTCQYFGNESNPYLVLHMANTKYIENVVAHDNCKFVDCYAFQNCSYLANVQLPEKLIQIGSYAFSHCSILPSLTIPQSVKRIQNWAFQQCSTITELVFPFSILFALFKYILLFCF